MRKTKSFLCEEEPKIAYTVYLLSLSIWSYDGGDAANEFKLACGGHSMTLFLVQI